MNTHTLILTSLAANLAAFILVPLALNGIIFALGWNRPAGNLPGLPPGWFVGTLWMLLFAAMGVARWLLLRVPGSQPEWITLLAFLCLLYPLYTAGLRTSGVGLTGNVLTLLAAIAILPIIWRSSPAATACIAPLILWLAYAATITAFGIFGLA